jgi:uncharacterized MAPEG superfamily protein
MFANRILPHSLVQSANSFLPSALKGLISTPQWGLYYGVLAIMLPCGLKLAYYFTITNPYTAARDNMDRRKSGAVLRATDPVFARLCGAEEHSFENAVFYLAGVIAAVQAGVDPKLITDYCSFWISFRLVHTFSYLAAWGGPGPAIAMVRTATYVLAAAASGMLFLSAAEASTA